MESQLDQLPPQRPLPRQRHAPEPSLRARWPPTGHPPSDGRSTPPRHGQRGRGHSVAGFPSHKFRVPASPGDACAPAAVCRPSLLGRVTCGHGRCSLPHPGDGPQDPSPPAARGTRVFSEPGSCGAGSALGVCTSCQGRTGRQPRAATQPENRMEALQVQSGYRGRTQTPPPRPPCCQIEDSRLQGWKGTELRGSSLPSERPAGAATGFLEFPR